MDDPAPTSPNRLADALRRELLNGAFPPGARLKEEDLAARFEVGRYTVRSALRSLVSAGLLVHETNRGAFVRELTRERIDELFDFRAVIELGSLRLALERGADLGEAESKVRELEALPTDAPWHLVTATHGAIHHAIVRASGNPRLLAAYESCADELRFMCAFVQPDFSTERLATLHRTLMKALHEGGETALRALRHDLEVSGRGAMHSALRRNEQEHQLATMR
ncbi:MAG: GntR family transcriptional regulator [Pseudonocardiaceae bacterium]|nr:GntR family transcriptional regulator [Pseudonocardiaceae bacterium]